MEPQINAFSSPSAGLKKKVLFLITQSEMGGAQQFLFQLLKHLDRNRFEPLVAVGGDGDGGLSEALSGLNVSAFSVPSLRRDVHPFSDLRAIGDVRELINKLKPDTVFLCSSKAGFIGSRAARGASPRPRIIYRIGGWTFNDPWPAYKKWAWRTLEKLSAKWKDVIIVNNTHDLKQAHELGIKALEDVVLVPNGVDPYLHTQSPAGEARKALLELIGRVDNPPQHIVGTVANYYPTKGLSYLLEAAQQMRDDSSVFVIMGDGSERSRLATFVEKHNLSQRVFLVGRVEKAHRYLSGFDLFVLPSVKEGFPWGILEAMSAKVPVVATRVGGIPDIIENGKSGLIVEPRNPTQLARAITEVLSDSMAAQNMALQAHQRLISLFSVQQMVSRIEAIL